jgi:hypothetical protein
VTETTTREVIELLRGWSVWHAAFGSAVSPDDAANMVDAAYGPNGIILSGAAYFKDYPRSHVRALAESYEALDEAIEQEKKHQEGFIAWLLLHEPYLGDPGDWRVVEGWREADDHRIKRHDVFVERLRRRLKHTRLYPIWPKPLSEKEEKTIEAQNAEIYATYQRIKNAGNTHNAAVKQTAAYFSADQGADLSEDAVERIIEFRDTLKLPTCIEEGCDRVPYSQNMCMRHYQQRRRRARRDGEAS